MYCKLIMHLQIVQLVQDKQISNFVLSIIVTPIELTCTSCGYLRAQCTLKRAVHVQPNMP